MNKIIIYVATLIVVGAATIALSQAPTAPNQANANKPAPMPPGPNPNSQYRLGPDSMPQPDVPKGEIRGPYTLPSNAYP